MGVDRMNRRVTEHLRGETDDVGSTFWPDHWAPMTWHRCVHEGCTERLDPWLHRTRCEQHQADHDAKRDRVHTIVAAARRAELEKAQR